MDALLTPVQEDRLIDLLVDPGLVPLGRAEIACPPGTPLAAVRRAWHVIGREMPATRLTVRDLGDAPATAVPAGEVAPLRVAQSVDRVAASADEAAATGGPLCTMGAIIGTEDSAGADDSAGVRILVLVYSPVALDDHAAQVVLQRATALASGDKPAPVPGAADYRAWHEAHVDRDALQKYWAIALNELDGPTPLFEESRRLPAPRRTAHYELSPGLATDLVRVARRVGVPPGWLVLLGWSVVVDRFRGGEPSAVGVLLDARPDGLTDAIGGFETTLPFVARLDRRPLQTWLVDQTAAVHRLHAAAHMTRADRNHCAGQRGTVSLFDSAVDLRPESGPTPPTPAVACTIRLESGDPNTLTATYDPDLVDDHLADQLLECLDTALTELTAEDGTTETLSLLPPEQTAAVHRHNETDADYPRNRCLHHLVEEQAASTPDAVALVFGDRTLTYAEANRRANRLAHDLIARGVRPDDIVGLCAEPSLDLVIGILGILKAGAAYAPLDPFFPRNRLDYLYHDLDCSVVLIEGKLLDLLPDDGVRNVRLDADDGLDAFAGRPEHDPAVDVHPNNLAYVMYTSGSTGRPKGVLIEHGGAVNFCWWMRERFDLRSDEAALQWTAYSFDAAVWELFWPLLIGGRAVIAPGKVHLDIDRFIDLVKDNEIATLHFVPAMLQTFLSADRAHECTSLRHVFVSGEPVPVSLLRRFHERLNADLINLYGVTEVSIDSTFYVCPRGDDLPFVRSGTPLHNTRTYVLDESMQPVPFGARGEVYIAGDSVTRGYLGRPGLAASRFVPDPFRGEGARMYRTGDIALLLPDGNVHFLGRADHQVKVRGIRIELLEVAAGMNEHDSVRESLVVPYGDGADRSLAAYVIAAGDTGIDVAELRSFLAERMPPYMVPTSVIVLDEFPLNANGKIDRSALPDPAAERVGRTAGRAPSGPIERRIAAIWCRLLELESVGADEEFFGIGGNSLIATQVIAEVRRTFDTRLSLREWLEASTIAQLADAIERHTRGEDLANEVLDQLLDDGMQVNASG
ncbi:non-ribosomal peptide synthetase [Solicola gregarius]|uniref:Amino acid adenylation domain-containing protein n=1 Tax=Solicola gregarius TaxID=2908642 RepID=A0AA46YIV9_9ACTN|nr:amino acid adenylation domain-containing protein [Solicola gregarius]UYM03630.1 amino acid adenylation domain-containing protein [Solicola gregarius]